LFILVSTLFCIAIYPHLREEEHSKILLLFFLFCGSYSAIAVVSVAWMTYTALKPLNHLLIWTKVANDLEYIPVPLHSTEEVSLVTQLVNNLVLRLRETQDALRAAEREAAIGQMCAQVAHDIRSPLVALEAVLRVMNDLPEENRTLMRSATERIRDIANNLLSNYSLKHNSRHQRQLFDQPSSSHLLASLVEKIVSEKRAQLKNDPSIRLQLTPDIDSYSLCSMIDPIEFKNMVSNIIDNAIEAVRERQSLQDLPNAKVKVMLSRKNDRATLQIKDNGVGISQNQMETLGEKGVTFSKKPGNGLGIYHAKKILKDWNGNLTFKSELGKGTTCEIQLLLTDPPQWFIPCIPLKRDSTIVIIDDDPSIHALWADRIHLFRRGESAQNTISLIHLYSPEELKEFIQEDYDRLKTMKFFVDYEFIHSRESGIDLIQSLSIESESTLVTSHFENPKIQAICLEKSISILPKSCVASVPLLLDMRAAIAQSSASP
jgi:signal transduction histidine kinase